MATASTLDIAPLQRTSGLRALATEQLMRAIFTRKIVAGDRLIVAKLAQQLGVSPSPVREALVELGSVGLLELLPNRGAVCLPFGPRQLREIFHVRRVLEAEAARLACGRLPDAELRTLCDRSQALAASTHSSSDWSQQAMEVDIALHDLVAECCQNGRLRHEIQRYAHIMRSIRQVAGNQRDIQVRAIEDHLTIIDSLLDGQAQAAAERMGEHISGTADRLVQLIFENAAEAQS